MDSPLHFVKGKNENNWPFSLFVWAAKFKFPFLRRHGFPFLRRWSRCWPAGTNENPDPHLSKYGFPFREGSPASDQLIYSSKDEIVCK